MRYHPTARSTASSKRSAADEDALDAARQVALERRDRAIEALRAFPGSGAREDLERIAGYAVARSR